MKKKCSNDKIYRRYNRMEQKKNVNVEELAREISNAIGENVEEKNIHILKLRGL